MLLSLVLSLSLAARVQADTLSAVDLYGMRTVSEVAVRDAVGVRPGDPIPDSIGPVVDRLHAISGVAEADARLHVVDSQLGRLSTFSGAEFVESLDLGGTRHLYLHGVDNTTGALLLGMPLAVVMGRRYDTPFSSVPLVKLDRAASTTDTIGSAHWDQSISTGGGNNPFMSGGFLTVSAGDFVVGRGDRPELR